MKPTCRLHRNPPLLLLAIVGLHFVIGNTAAFCGTIEGVVLSSKGPIRDSFVSAYKDYSSLASGTGAIRSTPGEKEGQFTLSLSPGLYYLTAEGTENGHKMFSYHGINPITVTDEYLWLPIFAVEQHEQVCRNDESQGIDGTITYKGAQLESGVVSVYPKQDGKFRGMGLLTNTLDAEHGFRFDLEPGSYVLIARKKREELGMGPVMKGDLFCYPAANPFQVVAAQFCTINVECYPRDDLASFLDDDGINPQGRRHQKRRNASLMNTEPTGIPVAENATPAVISGTIVDDHGLPEADMVVTAYPTHGLDLFQMHVLRLISPYMAISDKKGMFRIETDMPGTYYLVAREKTGEAPGRDEKYGLYEGNWNHSITINPGESRTGIVIPVKAIMPHSGLEKRLGNS